MFASSRLHQLPVARLVDSLRVYAKPNVQRIQLYANEARSVSRRFAKSEVLKETVTKPAGETAFKLGQGFVAGGAAVGMGALCFYGLGLSKDVGAMERSALWPNYVRERVKSTYMYFGGSLVFTAASAVAVMRTPALMRLATRSGWMSVLGSLALMWGTGILCQSLPYTSGLGTKQLAWAAHAASVGFVVAPLTLLGGPLLLRAAWMTAGVVGSLSLVAACAPSDKFLNMGGPLAIGLGVVFASSLGTMLLPPTGALGAGLYSISMYGGLVLFSLFLLYDTQKIIRRAEVTPLSLDRPYDPINNSVGIYLDTINIFIRIAMMLSGGGSKRK